MYICKDDHQHYYDHTGEHGWPATTVLGGAAPETDAEKEKIIDTIQDWKTEKYKDIIGRFVAYIYIGFTNHINYNYYNTIRKKKLMQNTEAFQLAPA
jgi:hypothetical protein